MKNQMKLFLLVLLVVFSFIAIPLVSIASADRASEVEEYAKMLSSDSIYTKNQCR